jgi:hypothetical protein
MSSDIARRLGQVIGISPIHLFDSATQVRDHDLLVRARAAEGLSQAATLLRDLAARYRVERIPPSTREAPFPPADRMAALRRLEERTSTLQDLAARVRSAELPPQDVVWERLRSSSLQYELMLEADLALVEPCQRCAEAARDLVLLQAEEPDGLGMIDNAAKAAGRALAARQALLSAS